MAAHAVEEATTYDRELTVTMQRRQNRRSMTKCMHTCPKVNILTTTLSRIRTPYAKEQKIPGKISIARQGRACIMLHFFLTGD